MASVCLSFADRCRPLLSELKQLLEYWVLTNLPRYCLGMYVS
jgi:hypothetical protein